VKALSALFENLTGRGQTGPDTAAADGGQSATDETPSSSLYECDECGRVFVALEKDACNRCEGPVEPVA
jgi:hypothetical protein